MQVWYIPTFLWSLGSDLCLSLEEFLVSPPPYVCSSRSACTPSALAAALRLCAALQVTLGDRLLPRRRSVGLLSSLWPEFRKTRSSKAYMCTQCACQAVRHRFSCGWCNMLKLSQPAHTGSTFQGKSSRKRLRSVHSTFNELCATVCLLCHILFFFIIIFINAWWGVCLHSISATNISSHPVDRRWCLWGMESSTSGSLQRTTICSCTKIKPWDQLVLTRWRTYNHLLLWWGNSSPPVTCCSHHHASTTTNTFIHYYYWTSPTSQHKCMILTNTTLLGKGKWTSFPWMLDSLLMRSSTKHKVPKFLTNLYI